MKKLILFIKRVYVFVIFIVLEVIAINYYSNSTSYTKARMLSATNTVAGGIYKVFARVDDYFHLRRENDSLVEEIVQLRNRIAEYEALPTEPDVHSHGIEGEAADYVVMQASVINNTVTRPENFFTIDKGARDGVEPEMAVVTPEGYIVGYVMECGERNSVAISVLNTEFRTSGRIKGRDYLGSILWNGRNPDYVTLSEIQRYAEIVPGDTVVTDYSSRFPKDMMIGTVEDYEMTEAGYFNVKVKVAAKFYALRKVLLIKYYDMAERLWLEEYNPER